MSIKDLRLEKGWSQEQLAELSNLSTRTIQRIEKDNKASLESIKSLAVVFKLEVNELKEKIENNEIKEINKRKENSFLEFLIKDSKFIKFLAINFMLLFINIVSGTEHLWFLYPLLGWGIPLVYKKYSFYKLN